MFGIQRLAVLILALGPGMAAAQTIHVSVLGDDQAAGTTAAPVKTIGRAIELGGKEILLESGQYLNETGLSIPAGVTIRGGYSVVNGAWKEGSQRTEILNTALSNQASVVLEGIAAQGDDPARMEWVRVLGGEFSIELRRGAELHEVELGGGTRAAIAIAEGSASEPARITRCLVTGGEAGIRVLGSGSAFIDQTMTTNTFGAGLDVTGTGTVTVQRSVFQVSSVQGASVSDNSNASFTNCVFRRNLSDGLRLIRSNVPVRGCFFELNENGLYTEDTALNPIENCTVVASRQAGLVVTRGTPNLRRNIFAYNSTYGVREERPEIIVGQPAPLPTVNSFEHNFFFQNSQGMYFDEGTTNYNTETELNNQVSNRQTAVGNRVADPIFANLATGNYRLTAASPAIDKVVYTGELTTDQQGNARAIDIAGVGVEGANAVDSGAFEFLGTSQVSDLMAVNYYDQSVTTDPDEPGAVLTVRRSPMWEFNPSNVFKSMTGTILPGRMRITSVQDQSVAFGLRRAGDVSQPNGKVLRIRSRIAARGDAPRMSMRLRTNWDLRYDSAVLLTVDGPQAFAPPPGGREYSMLVDLAQGNYSTANAAALPSIPYLFNLDTIDFVPNVPRPSLDMESLQVDLLDRTTLLSQFTQQVASWTFASGSEGWVAEDPIPGYGSPILRHSAAKGALEHAQLQFYSYGTWAAPLVDLAPGTDFLIRFRVSSDRPKETATSFRVRASDKAFMSTNELVITAIANGDAVPVPEGRDYTLLGTVSPSAVENGLRFYWDLYGFDNETRGGSIFLEQVTIFTKPNP